MNVCAAFEYKEGGDWRQACDTQTKGERGFNLDGFLVSASNPKHPFCPLVLLHATTSLRQFPVLLELEKVSFTDLQPKRP